MDDTRPLLQQATRHQWWSGWLHRDATQDGTGSNQAYPSQNSCLTGGPLPHVPPGSSMAAGWAAACTMASKAQSAFWESGLSCAGLANLVFACSALLIKLTGGRVPVLEVCIFRSAVSFVFSMVALLSQGVTPLFGHRHNLNLLALRGVSGTLAMATYYCSLFMLPLADAVTINQLKPPVTAIVAWLFLKEPLGLQGLLGCATAMGGVVVLAHPPFLFGGHGSWGGTRLVGTLFGLVSPFCAAGVGYSTRRIGKSEPAVVIALWFHMCTLVMLSGPLALGFPQHAKLLSAKDTGYLIGIAATSFVAQVLQTRGFQLTLAAKAAAVGFTQVVYGNIFGFCFFGEKPTAAGAGGTALVLLGVALVTVRKTAKQKPPAAAAATDTGGIAPADSLQPQASPGVDVMLLASSRPVTPLSEALEAKLLLNPLGNGDLKAGEGGLDSLSLSDPLMSGTIMAAQQECTAELSDHESQQDSRDDEHTMLLMGPRSDAELLLQAHSQLPLAGTAHTQRSA